MMTLVCMSGIDRAFKTTTEACLYHGGVDEGLHSRELGH